MIDRCSKLARMVHESLEHLILGIQGIVVMSSELDLAFQCMFGGTVPSMWKALYPSLMPLNTWTKDPSKRMSFFRKWLEKGEPSSLWLGRFTSPTSFLTAVLQRSADLDRPARLAVHGDPRELQQQARICLESRAN